MSILYTSPNTTFNLSTPDSGLLLGTEFTRLYANDAELQAQIDAILAIATTAGDLLVRNASALARFGIGTEGQVLVARPSTGGAQKMAWESGLSALAIQRAAARYGFELAADTDHDITITRYLPDGTSSSITKRLDATWAAGDNEGGMQSGDSLPTDGTVYLYILQDDDSDAWDVIGTDGSALVNPSGWSRESARDKFRTTTDSAANLRPFLHMLDAGIVLLTGTLVVDLAVTDQGTVRTTRTAVNLPPDVVGIARVLFYTSGGDVQIKVEALAHTDQAPALYPTPALSTGYTSSGGTVQHIENLLVPVNSSRQYATDSSLASTIIGVQFYGYLWRS